MFSVYSSHSADLEAEILVAETWQSVDLTSLFPTRWESGYRYSRSSFRRSESRMKVLAASVCVRVPVRPELIRIHQTSWKMQPGSFDKRIEEKREQLVEHRCGTPVQLPGGKRM